MNFDRRRLMLGAGSTALIFALPELTLSPQEGKGRTAFADPIAALPPSFPQQNPEIVKAVVSASHFDLDRVRSLVEPRPELARASWDWGFGDWETALGAASHTGRVEIAEYLMSRGARPDIFTFAMLGHLDAVKACIAAQPGIQSVPGPHGITLLSHARAGGERAQAVAQYLERLGGADPNPLNAPLEDTTRDALLGEYRTAEALSITVSLHPRWGLLTLSINSGTGRNLFHQGDLVFHPAGAPSVKVAFEQPAEGKAGDLTIHRAEGPLTARHIGKA